MSDISEIALIQVIMAAIVLFVILRLVQSVVLNLTYKRDYRHLNQILSIGEMGLWLVFIFYAATAVFKNQTGNAVIAVVVLLSILIWMSRFAAGDLFAGVILKSEDVYRIGESIRLRDMEGKIQRLGYRSLVIETENGEQIKIPYSTITGEPIIKPARMDTENSYQFKINIPKKLFLSKVTPLLRGVILNAPWSSVTMDPRFKPLPGDADHHQLEITVYSLAPEYFWEIESLCHDRIRELTGKELGDDQMQLSFK